MNIVNKFLTSTIIVLLLSSLLMFSINLTNVQAISKPSVPQFTVKLAIYSYDIPPISTTTISPYTREEITVNIPDRKVIDKKIEITIKNQPFTPTTAENGRAHQLIYTVQVKDHFSEEWKDWSELIAQADSEYTVVSKSTNYVAGDQIDFRVEAIIGHMRDSVPDGFLEPVHFITDISSGWSEAQTFTVPDESSNVSPSQTVTQSGNPLTTPDNNQPQIHNIVSHPLFLLGVCILFTGIVVAVILVFIKHHITSQTLTKQQIYKTAS